MTGDERVTAIDEIDQVYACSLECEIRDQPVEHPGVRASAGGLERQVLSGELTPALAARELLDTFLAAPA